MFENKNKSRSTVLEGIDIKEYPIKKLSEYIGNDIDDIKGFIITKEGKFGKSVLIIADEVKISLPGRYVEIFEDFTMEEVEACKHGRLILKNVREWDTPSGKTTTFDFADADAE